MNWILERLSERSTRVTILTWVAGLVGWNLAPELREHIVVAVGSIVSIIAFFTKEEK